MLQVIVRHVPMLDRRMVTKLVQCLPSLVATYLTSPDRRVALTEVLVEARPFGELDRMHGYDVTVTIYASQSPSREAILQTASEKILNFVRMNLMDDNFPVCVWICLAKSGFAESGIRRQTEYFVETAENRLAAPATAR